MQLPIPLGLITIPESNLHIRIALIKPHIFRPSSSPSESAPPKTFSRLLKQRLLNKGLCANIFCAYWMVLTIVDTVWSGNSKRSGVIDLERLFNQFILRLSMSRDVAFYMQSCSTLLISIQSVISYNNIVDPMQRLAYDSLTKTKATAPSPRTRGAQFIFHEVTLYN